MTALLDVDVLVALAWPNHVHHDPARAWFKDRFRGESGVRALRPFQFIRGQVSLSR